MNPDEVMDLITKINKMKSNMESISSEFEKFKVDMGKLMHATIKPGIGVKVAYNHRGFITETYPLELDDLPVIPYTRIQGLEDVLSQYDERLSNFQKSLYQNDDSLGTNGTACKVTYDSHGHVLNGSDLSVADIPQLPIEKIDGLSELMEHLKSMIPSNTQVELPNIIQPGFGCKVQYDSKGRIISTDELTVDDLPREFVNKINTLESMIVNVPSSKSIQILNQQLSQKVDGNESIKGGTFTKVRVDSKGLVTQGDQLTTKDLPTLHIDDIQDLSSTLRNKAEQSMVLELSTTVNSIVESISKINGVTQINNTISMKANQNDVDELRTLVNRLKKQVDHLTSITPSDMIDHQLQQLTSSIDTLSGRIAVVEQKMNLI